MSPRASLAPRAGAEPDRASPSQLAARRATPGECAWRSRDRAMVQTLRYAGSGKVEAIKIHYLVPHGHKVAHKRLLRVVTCIDFRDGSELGV